MGDHRKQIGFQIIVLSFFWVFECMMIDLSKNMVIAFN